MTPSDILLERTLGALVLEQPHRSKVFEQVGLDYCCGGQKPLGQACSEKGLDPAAVLARLHALDAPAQPEDQRWQTGLVPALRHIVETHHVYTKEALPRLLALADKVARVHGEEDPRLLELDRAFRRFAEETFDHLAKEEQILFPMIEGLEHGQRPTMPPTVRFPIAIMLREHEQHGGNLDLFRRLTDGYAPPEGACNSWRALLAGLEELEQDLHRHIHKENSYLFPLAIETEERALSLGS